MRRTHSTTRRQFLKRAATASAVALGAPYFVSPSALGLAGTVAPSDRIVLGAVGSGGKGRHNTQTFQSFADVQVVAVCDVDRKHLEAAKAEVDKTYGNSDCAAYRDFRELVGRQDIDVVSVATPDHWHALASVAAANADKDVYCEKPLANSVAEGRAICNAVTKHKRILQTGSHERSGDNARYAAELVRNGRIGKLHTLRINLPCDDNHHKQVREITGMPPEMPVPEQLDYDFWLGHTALAPYTERRCHFWWRFILSYGGGEMTDRGAHVIDLGQLGAGTDDTVPVEYEAKGTASTTSLYDAFFDYRFANTYANGLRLVGSSDGPRGVKFEGTEGWIFVHVHGGKLEAEPASLLSEKIGESEIHLGRSPGHHRNFIDCVKSREQPVAPAEAGHRTATICHLNNIAMMVGRKIVFDPKTETIPNDSEANQLLKPAMRSPWSL
jgi:predicted dehydrogenase